MGGKPYDLAVDSGGDQFPVTGPAPQALVEDFSEHHRIL